MLKISAGCFVQGYWEGFKKLWSEEYKVCNDPKICYETSAMFEFSPDAETPVYIEDNKFLANFDYSRFMIKGNEQAQCELDYYTSSVLDSHQTATVIDQLKKKRHTKQAVITLPMKDGCKMPCMMYMWLRCINGILRACTHMRANNAYGVLLMDLHINKATMQYIAKGLGVGIGEHLHFIDSYHFYKRDIKEASLFLLNFE
jgi:hypothetical protein